MIIKMPRTRSPAMTTTSFGNPNIKPPFSTRSGLFVSNASPRKLLLRKFFPPLHVGDSLFVPLDHDLSPFLDRFAVIAARAGTTPHSRHRENHFAGTVLPDRHADGPERTLHPVVFALHRCVGRIHEFHHETEDHPSTREARYRGEQKADDCKQVRMPSEEIARST